MTVTLGNFVPLDGDPPSSAYATFEIRSTTQSVAAFVHGSTSTLVFTAIVPAGASLGSGLAFTLWWASDTATTGNVVWGCAVDNVTSHSIDTDSYGAQVTATATTNATAAKPSSTSITVTGLQSLAVEQPFRLQVQRLGANASDTMTDDADLIAIEWGTP